MDHIVTLVKNRAPAQKIHRHLQKLEELGGISLVDSTGKLLTTDTRVIYTLLHFGADVNAKNADGQSALLTELFPNKRVIRNLINHGLDIDAKNNMGQTMLIEYSIYGFFGVIEYLSSYGADINARDFYGTTAVTHAARGISKTNKDGIANMNFLIERGGIGNMRDIQQALDIVYNGDVSADIHIKNLRGSDTPWYKRIFEAASQSALFDSKVMCYKMVSAAKENDTGAIHTLKQKGVDINCHDADGFTPLTIASLHRSFEAVVYLIQNGADVNVGSYSFKNTAPDDVKNRLNPLLIASREGHEKIVLLLLEAGADLRISAEDGMTSLYYAATRKRLDMVNTLLDMGAKPNLKMSYGSRYINGLSLCVELSREDGQYTDICEALVRAGAESEDVQLSDTIDDKDLLGRTSTLLRRCEYIDDPDYILVNTECLHISHRNARRFMMRRLNAESDPSKISFPTQSSGTCWFFATISILFLSDMARINSKKLRQSMIMGRTDLSKSKPSFTPARLNLFLRLNMMIQAALDGSGEESITIRCNEGIVHDLGFVRLNDGYYPSTGITRLATLLSGNQDFATDIDDVSKNTKIITREWSADAPLTIEVGDNVYILDSVELGPDGHAVAGITLAGEYYVADSNIGLIEFNWPMYLDGAKKFKYHPTAQETSFKNSEENPKFLFYQLKG